MSSFSLVKRKPKNIMGNKQQTRDTITVPEIDVGAVAVKNERDRIIEVYDRSEPGYDKQVREMMADGKTTGTEAGDRIFMAGKPKREAAYKKMQEKINRPDNFRALCDNYQAGHKCSKFDAIRAIAESHPEEHKKYIKNTNHLRFLKKTWDGNQSLRVKYDNDYEKFCREKANVVPSANHGKDFKALMVKHQAEHGGSRQEALRACAKLYPEEHLGI